ncbi:hypothetical protein PanWU01x14_324640 [Parasponia andersonii]|uniref:Uncharacterized protein n=1 Tax=Parasponia andersonii TaxID=3476 RepID=A0A2P5AKA9_PARAD|nr:hypothetical protein PanWU01x14_324640 [Parasponia andersonii]
MPELELREVTDEGAELFGAAGGEVRAIGGGEGFAQTFPVARKERYGHHRVLACSAGSSFQSELTVDCTCMRVCGITLDAGLVCLIGGLCAERIG